SFVPLFAITAAIIWYIYQSQDNSKLPPGPKGVPLLGYIPFLGKNHHLKFAELAKVYGPIVRFKYGMVNVVVLNDYASVKKWLTHTAFHSRLRNVFCTNTGLLGTTFAGIGTLNGEAWRTNRRLCLGILRDNGWKQAVMEEQTKEELQYFCGKLSQYREKPVPIKQLAMTSIANGIMKILMSVSYPFGDPRRVLLDRHMSQVGRAISSCSLIVWAPLWLYSLVGRLPYTSLHSMRSGFQGIVAFIKERVREHQELLDENSSLDFTDAFLKETCEYRKGPDSHISVKYAAGHVLALLSAGTNPVSSSIVWHLLNCADKPGLQNKIREEIDRVIGQQRMPAWGDRYNMPFTMACIWETYRWRTMNPIGIPRGCEEDVSID
ncbi:cytochrome P450, putative, partial [Ixodes scapularis]